MASIKRALQDKTTVKIIINYRFENIFDLKEIKNQDYKSLLNQYKDPLVKAVRYALHSCFENYAIIENIPIPTKRSFKLFDIKPAKKQMTIHITLQGEYSSNKISDMIDYFQTFDWWDCGPHNRKPFVKDLQHKLATANVNIM